MKEYEPTPRCPECDAVLRNSTSKCKKCGAKLVYCERSGHLVDENDYMQDVGMSEDCWEEIVKG